MSATGTDTPHRVLISGSGIAALEATLVLLRHAHELCEIELVSPLRDFAVHAPARDALDAFGRRPGLRLDLGKLADELGVGFRADAVTGVDRHRRVAQTRLGERLPYDSLIIASGTRLRVAVPGAITAWGHTERGTPGTLIPELLLGDIASLAFCVPGADPWPLPVYELAILTARRLGAAGRGDAELVVVTPESAPGEGLGPEASEALLAVLEEAGIGLVPGRVPLRFESGTLLTTSEAVSADRAVAPPRHDGCYLAELPLDDEGFIPADALGRVPGADGVHAAGEVTSFPLRHAAIAAEQARAAAEAVALRAGAVLSPTPWRATISGRLLACPLTRRLSGTSGLWWPPDVLAAPELRAYLAERVGFRPTLPEGGVPVELALEPRPPLSPPAVRPIAGATAAPPA